jgi:hypothetical protein
MQSLKIELKQKISTTAWVQCSFAMASMDSCSHASLPRAARRYSYHEYIVDSAPVCLNPLFYISDVNISRERERERLEENLAVQELFFFVFATRFHF